jgi:hypothetical protein
MKESMKAWVKRREKRAPFSGLASGCTIARVQKPTCVSEPRNQLEKIRKETPNFLPHEGFPLVEM